MLQGLNQPHPLVLREAEGREAHSLPAAPARRYARRAHAVLLHTLRGTDGTGLPDFQH